MTTERAAGQGVGTFSFRQLLLAIGVGAIIGLLLWVGGEDSPLHLELLGAAWVGVCIYLAVVGILRLLRPLVNRMPQRARAVPIVCGFFAGGISGWFLAAATIPWISFGTMRIGGFSPGFFVPFAGGIAVVLGLAFSTYERLRSRLADSIARIQEQEFAERELATARKLQERLLPPSPFVGPEFTIAARNLPAGYVAGDFFDYFALADGRVVAVVADVSGKGTAASLLVATTKAMLPFVAGAGSAGDALTELGRRIQPHLAAREFVALSLLIFDPRSGAVELANAGLPDPYALRAGADPRAIVAPGPRLPLGLRAQTIYQTIRLDLRRDERLLVVTDGLPEAPARGLAEPLGYSRFEAILANLPEAAEASVASLFAEVARASEPERADDWTALVLTRDAALAP